MGEALPGLLRAYVDETGDRGCTRKSSPWFGMAAVVIPDEDDGALRQAIATCKQRFGVNTDTALHWNQHVRQFPRRRYVAQQLGAVPNLSLNYVVFQKSGIPPSSLIRQNQAYFYNYVAGMTLERILLAARDWPGGSRTVKVIYGHVRGFNHQDTLDYFDRKRSGNGWVPWSLLSSQPQFLGQNQYAGLQAADQYAGMLHCALVPDNLGFHEEHHLLAISSQIRRRYDGRSDGYGWKIMAAHGAVTGMPWWPSDGL